MASENKILSGLLHSREVHEALEELDAYDDFGERAKLVAQLARQQYQTDSEMQSADLELLQESLHQKYPKHADNLCNTVLSLEPVSVPNLVDSIYSFRKEQVANKLSIALLGHNEKEKERLLELYHKICDGEVKGEELSIVSSPDIHSVLEVVSPDNLIPLYPRSLSNNTGGGAVPGGHALLYALSDMGKTAFSINMACGFMFNGKKTLYIGNEDPERMMLMRFYSCLTGMDRLALLKDPDRAQEMAYARGLENLRFASMAPGTLMDIERLVAKHEPDVLVVDQIHNIHGKKQLNKVEHLEHVTQSVRQIAKDADIFALSVTQAAETAYGKATLEMRDVFYSNVGIQAHVDLMIGLGADTAMEQNNTRMISLSKNKWGAHAHWMVGISPQISRIRDL